MKTDAKGLTPIVKMKGFRTYKTARGVLGALQRFLLANPERFARITQWGRWTRKSVLQECSSRHAPRSQATCGCTVGIIALFAGCTRPAYSRHKNALVRTAVMLLAKELDAALKDDPDYIRHHEAVYDANDSGYKGRIAILEGLDQLVRKGVIRA